MRAINVSDTFDALRERSKTIRTRLDRVDWCSISVEVEGFSEQSSRYTAVVRIDGGVAGDLVGGAPRSFRVEPGKHTVVVRLRKRLWLRACPQKAIVSLDLALAPGEQARLICGVRPEARKMASRAHAAEMALFEHFWVGIGLAAAIGWVANPAIRNVITLMGARLRVPGFWVPIALWIVGSRVATAAWAIIFWWFLMGWQSVDRRRRAATNLKVEIVDPYYLKRVDEQPAAPESSD